MHVYRTTMQDDGITMMMVLAYLRYEEVNTGGRIYFKIGQP